MTQVPRQLFPKTRRAFLGAVGQTAAVIGLTMGSPATYSATHKKSARSDGSKDVGILNVALALEHEGIAAYRLAGASGLLKPATLQVAKVFMGHHQQHRDSLASLVSKAGGKPVAPQSDAQYAQALNLAALKTEGDVLVLATRLERGAASAYVGQVAALHDFKLAQLFSGLASDEAAHWATLNNAQNCRSARKPICSDRRDGEPTPLLHRRMRDGATWNYPEHGLVGHVSAGQRLARRGISLRISVRGLPFPECQSYWAHARRRGRTQGRFGPGLSLLGCDQTLEGQVGSSASGGLVEQSSGGSSRDEDGFRLDGR